MKKSNFSLILTAIWPGFGHLYLKKPQGLIYPLIWGYLLCRFLLIFPVSAVMGSYPMTIFGLSFSEHHIIILVAVFIVWFGFLYDNFQILKKEKNNKTFAWVILPFFITILTFIFFSLPLKWRKTDVVLGNLHTHSRCSDGTGSYEQVVSMAQKLGFSFISFTDHRFSKPVGERKEEVKHDFGYDDQACREVWQKCQAETRLLCLLGQEVTGPVHILAIGIKEEIGFPPAPNRIEEIKQVVAEIHRQGGLAIAAHPFYASGKVRYREEELTQAGFDAMECERSDLTNNRYQMKLKEKYHLPCVYNSDNHPVGMLTTVYNVCRQPVKTLDDLKVNIRGDNCRRFSPIYFRIADITNLL